MAESCDLALNSNPSTFLKTLPGYTELHLLYRRQYIGVCYSPYPNSAIRKQLYQLTPSRANIGRFLWLAADKLPLYATQPRLSHIWPSVNDSQAFGHIPTDFTGLVVPGILEISCWTQS